jgi:hypothetical protein
MEDVCSSENLVGINQQTGITLQKTWLLILILLFHLCSGPPSGHFYSGICTLYEMFSYPMHATYPPQGYICNILYIYIYMCVCVCECS